MVPKTVDGLPFHPLLVHATVVVIPLAAIAVLIAGVWPRARQSLRWSPVALSAVALILLPLTYQSGENLEDEIGEGPLIERHSHLAHQLLWPVIGLLIAAIVVEAARRMATRDGGSALYRADSGLAALTVIGAVLAVVFAAGTVVQTVRVGNAGAKAVWHGRIGNDGDEHSLKLHASN